MATHSQGNSKSKTVSAEPELIDAAVRRQRALRFRTFSGYVQSLLRKDLDERKNIVFSETRNPALNDQANSTSAVAAGAEELGAAAEREYSSTSSNNEPPRKARKPKPLYRQRTKSGPTDKQSAT